MKLKFFLFFLVLQAACLQAADGDFAQDLNLLNEQRAKASAGAADASGLERVEAKYYELLAALRQKALTGADARTVGKIDVVLGASGKVPAQAAVPSAIAHPALPKQGSLWSGLLVYNTRNKNKVNAEVIASEGDTFTLRIEGDTEFIWEYTCKIDKDKFKVIEFNRVRAMRGARASGTAKMTGSGEIKGDVITLRYVWPHTESNDISRGTFTLSPK